MNINIRIKDEMRILVCGGRDYNDYIMLDKVLTLLSDEIEITEIIHGAATGADSMAGYWARLHNITETPVPADWTGLHCAAGRIRNKKMLDMNPDAVIAFPGGNGTKNMVSISKKAGVPVWKIPVKED